VHLDIYKAVESLEVFAGGGESSLKHKKWVKPKELTVMKRTANCFIDTDLERSNHRKNLTRMDGLRVALNPLQAAGAGRSPH
jgi:hypothetical protein